MEGKKVLITGSSRGIGYTIAEKLLALGAEVFITGRNQSTLSSAKKKLKEANKLAKISSFKCDFEDLDSVNNLQSKLETIDMLICNVGSGKGPSDTLPEPEEFLKSFNKNFMTAYNASYIFEQKLIKSKGQIIFISSIVASQILPAPTSYTVSKTALNTLAKTISRKLAPQVRVNVISPGNILFKGGTWEEKLLVNKKEVDDYIESNVPMKVFGTPNDIASAVIFLSSKEAKFICGTTLIVDGGQVSSL